MPDMFSDRVHHATVRTTESGREYTTTHPKCIRCICKAIKAYYQKWKKGYSKMPNAPEHRHAAEKKAASPVLPSLRSGTSFEQECEQSFDAIESNNSDVQGLLKHVKAASPVIVENKNHTAPSAAVSDNIDAAEQSSALLTADPHTAAFARNFPKDSFDLVRAQKPHLIASNNSREASRPAEASPSTETMSDLVRRTIALVPRAEALVAAGRRYLASVEANLPTRPKPLTVSFRQLREQQHLGSSEPSDETVTVKETSLSVQVTRQTTMQELRYILQLEAARQAVDPSTLPGEIFGSVFLLLGGVESVLANDMWEHLKGALPTSEMGLVFKFQVRRLVDGVIESD